MAKNLSHPVSPLPAQDKHDDNCLISPHTVNKPFSHSIYCHVFHMIVLFVGDFTGQNAPPPSIAQKCYLVFPGHKKAVMCLTEKIRVLNPSGMSFSAAVSSEVNVNE